MKKLFALFCAIIVLASACSNNDKDSSQSLRVRTLTAKKSRQNVTLESYGSVTYKKKNDVCALVDGTIVEHRYPEIGREIPFATDTLKMLINDRHKLILWSVREGRLLDDAVEWCRARGVEFYAINKDFPEEDLSKNQSFSRKLKADVWIDDRNIGGLPDWGTIYRMISHHMTLTDIIRERLGDASQHEHPKKKHWWQL